MLSIARRQAARLGIDQSEVHGITNLGGSATGATMGGRIHLDPRAFREVFDSRLGRTVSPIENLKRNLIHEHAHVLQSTKRADLYWSGTPLLDKHWKTWPTDLKISGMVLFNVRRRGDKT